MPTTLEGLRELTSSFTMSRNERGQTAQRVFVYEQGDTTHTADLPDVGDEFDYPFDINIGFNSEGGLLCRSVEVSAVNADQTVLQFTCNYSNEPCDRAQFTPNDGGDQPTSDPSDLPVTMEYAGEFVLVQPNSLNDSQWLWKDNHEGVIDPICFKVNQVTMRLQRFVPNDAIDTFHINCRRSSGHVNKEFGDFTLPGGGGKGCWLFGSATTEMFRNHNDEKMWRAELLFTYRDPDGLDVDGWNKILRRDGTWQIPVKKGTETYPTGGDPIYSYIDFQYLFNDQEMVDTVVP